MLFALKKNKACERALTVLGQDVKTGLEAVLQRAKDKAKFATPSRAPVLEVTLEAARVRVVNLEAALAALVDVSGPDVDTLRNALARAKVSVLPTSGCAFVAMSTINRTDCQTHRRS